MLAGLATVAQAQDATVSVFSSGNPLPGGYSDERGNNAAFRNLRLSTVQSSPVPYRVCFSSSLTTPSFGIQRGRNSIALTNGCHDHHIDAGFRDSASFAVWGNTDSLDEPDEVVTLTFTDDPDNPRPSGVAQINVSSTVTIRDDDPTVVSLARVGSGAVTEGGKVEFTVTLGRALIAGETIDVPLSIGGTSITTGDWSLALKSSATNTGVTLRDAGTTTPEVRFTNAGAQTATLELTATADGTAENAETFEIALGANSAFDDANLGTNVGGGADPHGTNNAFDVTVNNAGTNPPANNAPTVANSIPNQAATVGTAFSYTFPTSTFSDDDGDGLTYTAAKSDDTALPTWLSFDAVTRTFSGTPQSGDTGTLSVKVTADDRNGGTASDTFDIVVSAAPATPTLSLSLASTSGNEGNSGNSDVDVTLTLSPTRSASTAFDFCVKNTGTAIFRTDSGGEAKDFDIVHFSGGSQLSMTAQNCDRYTVAGNSGSSQVTVAHLRTIPRRQCGQDGRCRAAPATQWAARHRRP